MSENNQTRLRRDLFFLFCGGGELKFNPTHISTFSATFPPTSLVTYVYTTRCAREHDSVNICRNACMWKVFLCLSKKFRFLLFLKVWIREGLN